MLSPAAPREIADHRIELTAIITINAPKNASFSANPLPTPLTPFFFKTNRESMTNQAKKKTKKYAILPFIGVAATITKVVNTANATDNDVMARSRGVAAHGLIGFTVVELILAT
jgi:hypothetical protein